MTSANTPTPRQLFTVLLAGSLVLLVVHGLGRFIYTPLLPYLVADNQFNAPDGAAVATWNYLGYLMGAMLAIRWHRIDQIRLMLPKVDVESEFAPIIGTEKQSEELVRYLMQDFEDDPLSIWNSDIFGRSLPLPRAARSRRA